MTFVENPDHSYVLFVEMKEHSVSEFAAKIVWEKSGSQENGQKRQKWAGQLGESGPK